MTEPLACRRCGCMAVRWMQTKAGKWYLAGRVFEPGLEAGYARAMAKVPHKCSTHEAIHAKAVEEHAARFYAGAAR